VRHCVPGSLVEAYCSDAREPQAVRSLELLRLDQADVTLDLHRQTADARAPLAWNLREQE